MGDTDGEGSLQFWDMGLTASSGYGLQVIWDVWEHEDIGVYTEHFTCKLKPHHCKVLKS